MLSIRPAAFPHLLGLLPVHHTSAYASQTCHPAALSLLVHKPQVRAVAGARACPGPAEACGTVIDHTGAVAVTRKRTSAGIIAVALLTRCYRLRKQLDAEGAGKRLAEDM